MTTSLMPAIRWGVYLCLCLFCLYVSFIQLEKYIQRPTTTKVSQVPLQSGDLPRFAICPQPSLNVSALQNLTGFNRTSFDQTSICKIDGCKSLDTFGHFVEENGMDSREVDEFYNDLNLRASEVVHSVTVHLQNSDQIAIDDMDGAEYMLPLYEMGDCPVYRIPEGLGDASKIV